MPNPRKFWLRFSVEHMGTGERADFIGEGASIVEAVTDAAKGARDAFRPSSSGAPRPAHGLIVKLKDGRSVKRTIEEFESGIPYAGNDDLGKPTPDSASISAPKVEVFDV